MLKGYFKEEFANQMPDISIDLNKALTDITYARSVIRSGKLNESDRNAIVAKYGYSQVTQWESVDSTDYESDDGSWDKARLDSKNDTAKQVGYSGDKNYGTMELIN